MNIGASLPRVDIRAAKCQLGRLAFEKEACKMHADQGLTHLTVKVFITIHGVDSSFRTKV